MEHGLGLPVMKQLPDMLPVVGHIATVLKNFFKVNIVMLSVGILNGKYEIYIITTLT